MGRFESRDVPKESSISEAELERQILLKTVRVELSIRYTAGYQRLRFARERKAVLVQSPVKRFDSQTIPRSEKPLLPLIPDGETEHTVQALQAPFTEFLVEVNDYFGIAVRSKYVTAREFTAQFEVVVDFAVEYDPDSAVLVGHRLLPGLEIDD